MNFVVENSFQKHYVITNRPATPLPKGKRNHGGFFYLGADYSYLACCIRFQCSRDFISTGIQSTLENVHAEMRGIAAVDSRFDRMMGVTKARMIGMCWGVEE